MGSGEWGDVLGLVGSDWDDGDAAADGADGVDGLAVDVVGVVVAAAAVVEVHAAIGADDVAAGEAIHVAVGVAGIEGAAGVEGAARIQGAAGVEGATGIKHAARVAGAMAGGGFGLRGEEGEGDGGCDEPGGLARVRPCFGRIAQLVRALP